jgi:hypothetical protein
MRRGSLPRAAIAAAALGLILVACSPPDTNTGEPPGEKLAPDAPLEAIQNETIDEARPAGVVFGQSFEERADGVQVRFNTQRWDYVAPNEAALIAAANELRSQAVADGWTVLEDYVDPGRSGIFTATLTKGAMRLTLRYVTVAGFDIDPDDVNELRLTGEIVYDPSSEAEGGAS